MRVPFKSCKTKGKCCFIIRVIISRLSPNIINPNIVKPVFVCLDSVGPVQTRVKKDTLCKQVLDGKSGKNWLRLTFMPRKCHKVLKHLRNAKGKL